MPRPVDRKAAYYPGLDGLRAIAVTLVILYHVGVPHMGGGLLGVGVFFTLSGYLITSILLSSWERKGSLTLGTFWLRRARRLLPAVIIILIVSLLATMILKPGKLGEYTEQALAALFYVANWHTIMQGDTYFNRFQGPSPFDHLWSLSVEEQFYVLWPLLLLALLKIFKSNLKNIAITTFILGTASMVLLALTAHAGQDATRAYEGTDTRAGGLLWGAALAMIWHPKTAAAATNMRTRIQCDVAGVLGLVGIVLLVMFTTEQDMFIYRGGIALLTVATCGVLYAAAHPQTIVGRVLGIAPLRWIGERTYGIYLWHMPVAAFLPERSFYGNTLVRGLIVVVITLVMASLSWTIIEDPIRKWGLLEAWRRGTAPLREGGARRLLPPFVAGGVVVTLLGTGALAVVGKLPQKSVSEIAKEENKKGSDNGITKSAPKPKGKVPLVAHPPKTGALKTSCTSVAHIGDSTSLGLSDGPDTNVTDPKQRMEARYKQVGVTTVTEDIRGARAIIEHFKSDPNGAEAVQNQVNKGFKGCWVIALGMNDAATIANGGTPFDEKMRVDKIMGEIPKDQNVLWVTSVTQAWTNQKAYDNKNMVKFNKAVVDATKQYPNLRVYDWQDEALPHADWFLQDDANHNNGVGSAAKALGISRALAVAFPAGKPPVESKIVASK